MREITTHKVNPVNDLVQVFAIDEPGSGGANHCYRMSYTLKNGSSMNAHIEFQNGPIAEAGVNGITQEVLLAIVADRLECFQKGPFACAENEEALRWVKGAQEVLFKRTRERMERGVEGTHKA